MVDASFGTMSGQCHLSWETVVKPTDCKLTLPCCPLHSIITLLDHTALSIAPAELGVANDGQAHPDSVGFCPEVVDFQLLPANLVSKLLLLVCQCMRLTVQPPVNCRSTCSLVPFCFETVDCTIVCRCWHNPTW